MLAEIGFTNVCSVKLGIKGWNDADLDLVDEAGVAIDGDDAVDMIELQPRPEQIDPARR